MDTTVITAEEYDFGTGKKDRRIQFVGCRWSVDDRGCLHVFEPPSSGRGGVSVAAFAEGTWQAVTNGQIQGAGVSVAAVKR